DVWRRRPPAPAVAVLGPRRVHGAGRGRHGPRRWPGQRRAARRGRPPARRRGPAVDVAAPGPRGRGRPGRRSWRRGRGAGRRGGHGRGRMCDSGAHRRLRAGGPGQRRGRHRRGPRRLARGGGGGHRRDGAGDAGAGRHRDRGAHRPLHPPRVLRVRLGRPRAGRGSAGRRRPGHDERRRPGARPSGRGAHRPGGRRCRPERDSRHRRLHRLLPALLLVARPRRAAAPGRGHMAV
ncbi:MAG: FIG00003370: Multicopper polyphenol oxidase, partial [uncultured Acidimicrobiales bacterium]